MGRFYFDTSALVKNYHAEAGTADVQRMLREAGSEFFISRLATVEMLSGFAGKVRAGVFTSSHFGRLRLRFLADVRRRMVRPIRVLNVHYQMAGDLIGKHAMSRPLRTLDAIQLAVALHFHRSFPIDHFVCADQRLCDVATSEGLKVINPGP
jgi:predicted nucleic acid-binding protein